MRIRQFQSILLLTLLGVFSCFSPSPQKTAANLEEANRQLLTALIHDAAEKNELIHPRAYQSAQRLGIHYPSRPDKFWLLYPIDETVIARFLDKEEAPRFEMVSDDGEYQVSRFLFPKDSLKLRFYWKDGQLIAPVDYYTRDWQVIKTRYFQFRISDPSRYHPYAAAQLDSFVEEMLERLHVPEEERRRLEKRKIVYCLARDADEVQQLSSFPVRGVYLLGNDYIVSFFNCHRHEVAHLLINYALKNAPLYVYPFLQEGFASAWGGRGDQAPAVIGDVGVFLETSGFLSYRQLFNVGNFRSLDPSLSYPVAAVYNRFLMSRWGTKAYLEFYTAHSAAKDAALPPVTPAELPEEAAFKTFLKETAQQVQISAFPEKPPGKPLIEAHWGAVWADSLFYYFRLRGSIRLRPEHPHPGFVSAEFREVFPDLRYSGEQYVLSVSEDEVKLFNFYTAVLQAFYARGLSTAPWPIRSDDGMYQFRLRRETLPENLAEFIVSQ